MGFYKLGFKTIIIIFIVAISLVGCTKKIREDLCFVLNTFGILYIPEANLGLELDKQDVESPFSFVEYCNEKYDSVVFLCPYSNVEDSAFANLNMSNTLREKCDGNTMFDTFSTLLFVINGKVEAYSEVIRIDADFVLNGNTDYPQFFSFGQKLIMDKDRKVHLYNE